MMLRSWKLATCKAAVGLACFCGPRSRASAPLGGEMFDQSVDPFPNPPENDGGVKARLSGSCIARPGFGAVRESTPRWARTYNLRLRTPSKVVDGFGITTAASGPAEKRVRSCEL